MGRNRLIPSDFDNDRIFYLHVDPVAVNDSCMTTKEFSCPPSISLTAIKPQGPLNNSQQRTTGPPPFSFVNSNRDDIVISQHNLQCTVSQETLHYPLAVFPSSVSTCQHQSSDPGTAIQGAQLLTCLKLLTSTQVQNSAVVIPLRFAESAFPSRHNHVNMILENGSCYQMGLRWSKKRKVQLYLTRGWMTFAKYNGFRAGTILEFSILPSDEITLHVKILKI
ncbi:uncharacterized protein DS421_20g690960 [Arachis hypogaea]|nr:uncharacterized protein DS421_20g690960 [Arachis hypogaea]